MIIRLDVILTIMPRYLLYIHIYITENLTIYLCFVFLLHVISCTSKVVADSTEEMSYFQHK